LDFDPNKANISNEQKAKLIDVINRYSDQFGDILEGANFRQLGTNDKMIEGAKKWWEDFQNGLIKLAPRQIEVDFTQTPVVPKDDIPTDVKMPINLLFTADQIKLDDAEKVRQEVVKAFAGVGKGIGDQISSEFGDAFQKQFERKLNAATLRGISQKGLENLTTGLNTAAVVATKSFIGLADSFAAVGEAILTGGNALQAFAATAKNAVVSIVTQLIKAVALAGILSLITGGASNAAGGGLSFLQAFGRIIPGFAKGGVVPEGYPNDTYLARLTSGETIVPRGGEYEFAKSIMGNYPDFKLGSNYMSPMKSMGNTAQVVDVNIRGQFSAAGTDLNLVLNRVQRSQRRTS
jgi:hypothetical protein